MNKTVILQGSSRSFGDTQKIVNSFALKSNFDIIDLNTKNIGHYDYEYKNAADDFMPLITDVITNYSTIIFATPVYWYTMSGIMKAFFDRISDVIRTEKDLGRQLRGKKMAMISTSNGNDLVKGFNMPFVESAKYLGMQYLGDIHTWVEQEKIPEEVNNILDTFLATLKKTI
ncbi:NAD(P)H-dependent oxidoreductase [Oceanihabitans sp. 2_MG-2023]|uniref:flavodoxin family protein n=1 Tax=Oceanihabitans sp. 2_MG-2023 TaxID=3062661 RepID=UPI0026E13769|nr:NAD(P)H-dependent oxidoreductase [Oceanihabitans sp. 2_MG-2023]MDO6598388.1 NAD(P)H-dependent oxidoreductase [Oceanihabitans sp. 2_MG-2023]